MNTRRTLIFGLLAVLGLIVGGCKGESGSGANPSASGAQPGSGPMTLNGAGATFPYPLYSKWISEYNHAYPDIRINYQSIGSGGGIRQITAGTVDFGASDAPMTADEEKSAPSKLLH